MTQKPHSFQLRTLALWVALAATTATGTIAATEATWSLGTAFSYQGRLQHAGQPASGSFDLGFELYDSRESGIFLGRVEMNDVPVRGGAFVVELDFGRDVFAEQVPWLEIQVRPAATGAYAVLVPRQRLASAGGGCTVDSDVQINGTLDLDAAGTVPELRVACCNDVDDGGQIFLNGFLGALAISDNEIETTVLGSPAALKINADGGNVGIGVANPQAPLHLPSGPDVNPSSGGALIIGATSGASIAIDSNEIMARNNGAVALLTLNNEGGDVRVGGDLDIGFQVVQVFADAEVVQASCPAGKRVLSGGCSSGGGDAIEHSFPSSTTTWQCVFAGTGFANNGAAALCGRIK